jgi:uncharacterized protein YndB with AHSA1/START domain
MNTSPETASTPAKTPTPSAGRLWLKRVVVGLLVVVAVFAVIVATQPNSILIVRSQVIAAPPEAVFEHVNNFRQWEAWSPWAKLDPEAKNSFSGPESGPGAVFTWSGNDKVGEGQMEIKDSQPPSQLTIQLDFVRPYEDHSTVIFDFQPVKPGTNVTWTMKGEHNLISKIMCLFMDLDAMVGPDFERGLTSLKTIVESAEQSTAPTEAETPAATNAEPAQ